MKKFFLTAAFSLFAAIVISCGSGIVANGDIVKNSKAPLDTLSYVLGMNISNGMSRDVAPMKLDDELVKKTMEAAALGDDTVKVGDKVITTESAPNQISEFAMTVFAPRMQKLQAWEAAKNDTTATTAPEPLDFDTETMFANEDERAYISSVLGFLTGRNLINSGYPVNLHWLLQGYDDAKGANVKVTIEQGSAFMRNYINVVIPAENAKKSAEWLAQIEKEPGVKKTESGLLYRIEAEGDMSAKANAPVDTVTVHYKGTTRKGVVFDASRFADKPAETQEMLKRYQPDSYMNDTPVSFPLNRVIKGWTEGMQLVGKGGKITLWIPAELAYGKQSPTPAIGSNEALKFEVELIDVKPAK